jgi:hypothetical protein
MDASRFSGTPNRTIFDCRSTVAGWPLLRLGSGPLRASNDVQHTVLSWSSLALTDELNASNLHCRSVTIDCTGFLAISRNESIDIEYRYRCRYLLVSISMKLSTILFKLVSISNIGDTFEKYR